MRKSFVLVDPENVQPQNLHRLQGGSFEVRLSLGSQQSKVPLDMAQAMQALAAQHPGAAFHVISKDKGFDPLISHLNGRQICCRRWTSLDEISAAQTKEAGAAVSRADAVVENLIKRKTGRPRTLKTLRGTINALFSNQVSDAEMERLIAELEGRGVLRISEGKLTYHLPVEGR